MVNPPAWTVLLRFQMCSGVRVALRALAPLAAGFTAAAVLMGSPWMVLAPVVVLLYPTGLSLAHALVAAILTITLALSLVPRTGRAMSGWITHLPASASDRRRAAVVGLAVALAPWLLIVAAAGIPASVHDPRATLIRASALPILAVTSAYAALPVGWLARSICAAAAVISWLGAWWLLLLAGFLLWLADCCAGELRNQSGRSTSIRGGSTTAALPPVAQVWLRITFRALQWRLFGFWVVAVVSVVPAVLFITNNSLSETHELLALRLASLIGAVLAMAGVAETLSLRRPPWPWIRSMPWSSTARVLLDALVLLVIAAPAVLVVAWRVGALMPALAVLPVLSVRAAAAIRRAPGRRGGASGDILAEGTVAAMAVALVPQIALVALLLIPFALQRAAADEKQQDVSRWHELHHLAAGDPMSWSDS